MAGANVPDFSTAVPVGRPPAVRASRAGPDEARTLSRRFVRGLWCHRGLADHWPDQGAEPPVPIPVPIPAFSGPGDGDGGPSPICRGSGVHPHPHPRFARIGDTAEYH